MPPLAYQTRMDEVRRAEYGSRVEVAVRYAVLLCVSIVIYIVLQDAIAIFWSVSHLFWEVMTILLLRLPARVSPRIRYWSALGCYTMSGFTFAAMPLYLIATENSLSMIFAASAGVIGLAVYTLQRRHHDVGLMLSDMVQILLISASLLMILLPQVSGWSDRALIVFTLVALIGYYLSALFGSVQQHRQLRDAQHRYASAQKARALNQFVGGVAHDFNNQLTAILGHLELYDLLDDQKERASALKQSREAARRAALTVRQLLASSGRTRLTPRMQPIGVFLTDIKDLLETLLASPMKITLEHTPDDLSAFVDRDMLETCVIQAALNAQDACNGSGRIRLWAETWHDLPGGDHHAPETATPYSVVLIEDDGPGVPHEALPMLAEPFYTTKNVGEGSGLGLSAVAGFAKQSGGTLVLTNGTDAGLRLAIVLPSGPGPKSTTPEAPKASGTAGAPVADSTPPLDAVVPPEVIPPTPASAAPEKTAPPVRQPSLS